MYLSKGLVREKNWMGLSGLLPLNISESEEARLRAL